MLSILVSSFPSSSLVLDQSIVPSLKLNDVFDIRCAGSEISFFKNGVCQGVAFTDLNGGRYYPAASMYTQPNQPNCVVKFNFGPDFEFFPEDFQGRRLPQPMVEVPYHGFDKQVENGEKNTVVAK